MRLRSYGNDSLELHIVKKFIALPGGTVDEEGEVGRSSTCSATILRGDSDNDPSERWPPSALAKHSALQEMANNGDHEMSQSESVSSTSHLGVYVRE